MTITVYTVAGAPRAWRVLLALAFKNIDYDTKLLEASKREHKSSQYLKIHPRGTIPAMEADGMVLRDSIGILAWLDRKYPERPLFGASATDAAQVWQITLESCDYLRKATNDVLSPLLVQGKSIVDMSSEERITMKAAAKTLHDECQLIDSYLDQNLFLVGHTPSAADAICYPEISLIGRAIETKFDDMQKLGLTSIDEEFPKLAAWKARVSTLPNVDKTMPSHWA